MIEALSNIWFVVFVLLFAAIQLGCIAIEILIKERMQNYGKQESKQEGRSKN